MTIVLSYVPLLYYIVHFYNYDHDDEIKCIKMNTPGAADWQRCPGAHTVPRYGIPGLELGDYVYGDNTNLSSDTRLS
jgi:hypothetical protein